MFIDEKHSARTYSNFILNRTFGKAPKKKFCDKNFQGFVEHAYHEGAIVIIAKLYKELTENKYKDFDEILGDLQIWYCDHFNGSNRLLISKMRPPVTIESFLGE
jgi:hypothetical protein